jgi:uncharacterized membrane protein
MSESAISSVNLIMEIILMYFIAPAIISMIIHLIMKRLSLVNNGDMTLKG